MQVMIFAAGLGTRLKPLTDSMPKALVPVAGKPLLQHVIEKLADSCADKSQLTIVVNVHHFADQIRHYLAQNNNFGLNILISDETEKLLETGGGIKKAAPLFCSSEPILIHNVDILSNVALDEFYTEGKENAATLLVSNRKSTRGLYFDDDDNLAGWENFKTGEVKGRKFAEDGHTYRHYAFSGIHILSPRLFKYFDEFPDRFGIIDFYLSLCQKEKIKGIVKNDLRLLDVGKLESLTEAEKFVR